MSAPTTGRLIVATPPELVIHDAPTACPYLPERVARLPLRLPVRALARHEFETRLEVGDRRQGLLLYRTACPDCNACEPIRIDVGAFVAGRSQGRVFRRGERELRTEIGRLEPTLEKVSLYNRHKLGRGLSSGEHPIDLDGYRAFLGESCCDTFELRYRLGRKLVGVAIVDRSEHALSAVYCYFDPTLPQLGIGTYSILKQIELCRGWGLRWLYLGLYIADCSSMAYKSRFLPHERLLGDRWVTFDRPGEAP
ncbi:MAG: arginyltransferase [Nannocystaceae bacterium]